MSALITSAMAGKSGPAPETAPWEANISALWSVSVTSTGQVLISNQPRTAYYPIDGSWVVRKGTGYPCPPGGCDLTVTNNLGSSVTVFLGKPIY